MPAQAGWGHPTARISSKLVMAGCPFSGCGLFPGRMARAVIMPVDRAAFNSSTRSLMKRMSFGGRRQSVAMAV